MIIFLLPTKILMMTNKQWKNYLLGAAIFAFLSTLLIISWFRYGLLYGGGDVGIPSYNPSRIVEIAKYVWWEAGAPGNLVPHGVTSLPVQFFQSVLAKTGFPYFAIQAILFWILLFLTGYGMFLTALLVFGRDKFKLAILSGLFYMLNPFMMIQVWHRFIHNTFFLAAFLPFFYVFWDAWIKKGKPGSILLFLIFNIFGVYLYGTIAYLLTVFFLLSFIFLKHAFFPWQGIGHLKKTALRFAGGFLLWILIHAWWILPTFSIGPALFSAQHRTFDNMSTLITLSRQTAIPYILSQVNPFYLFENADFGEIYNNPFFLAIMFLPLLFLIPGFFAAVRSKLLSSFGILLVLAVFIAKGAAAPFGFIYIFALANIFSLGVLRNPFEKMGIILPFSAAIIMTAGVNWYLHRFKSRPAKILVGILLFLQLGVFLWPMWSGRMIGKFDKLALVDVPKYYGKTDEFISKLAADGTKLQSKEGKILHLPLPTGESVSYNWPNAFAGIESSQLLFTSLPSISRGLNINYVDDIIKAASNIYRENPTDEEIIAVLQSLNVRFIVLHNDIVWQGGYLDNPLKLQNLLDGKEFLEKIGIFGDLTVYEVIPKYFKPRIYASTQVNLLIRGQENSFWPFLLVQNNADFISQVKENDQPFDFSQTLVMPQKIWTFHPQTISLEKALIELPAASKILPGSRLYFLIKLKEDLRILISLGPEKLKMKLNFAGKRLVEAVRLKEKGNLSDPGILAYRKLLSEVFYSDNLKDRLDFVGGRGFVNDLFAKHMSVLDSLEGSQTAKDELLTALRESELIPMYDVWTDGDNQDPEYTAYHFQVPHKDNYELLMAYAKVRNIYSDNLEKMEFQINGKIEELSGKVTRDLISYSTIKLDKGKNEIILASAPSLNLTANSKKEIKIPSEDKNYYQIPLTPLTFNTWYTVKFEAKIVSGNKFKLQLLLDGKADFEKFFTNDKPDDWMSLREGILINKPAAADAIIRFVVEEADTAVILRNIKTERLLNNPIFLRSAPLGGKTDLNPKVEFREYSPIYYSGKIKIDKGGFVIFSEAFHPDWKLTLSDGQTSFSPGERFLANMYANAWFIPEAGEYNFKLEFTPQRTLYKGLLISSGIFAGLIIFYFLKRKIKNV